MNSRFNSYFIFLGVAAIIAGMLIYVRHGKNMVHPSIQDSSEIGTVLLEPVDSFSSDDPRETNDVEIVSVDSVEEKIVKDISIKFRSTGYFKPPLQGSLSLSGTFGELRHNHFHAGLDIRTGGVEGAEVFAAASGYVSRIKISERGYGKAIYIQHPNGATTVYGHLQRYDGAIQEAVIKRHYALKSYEMDWYPTAGSLPVKQGQRIAFSGNSGGSGGPHLHFEIRDGKGSDTYNPLLYGIEVKDNIAPVIRGIQLFQIDEDVRVKTGSHPWRTVSLEQKTVTLEPGTYGVGASWIEFFTDKLNRLGLNYASMEVDGRLVFSQELEHFAFDEGRFINQHINYFHFSKTGVRYIKMFKDKGNSLRFYKGNGVIELKANEEKTITIHVRDMAGHTDAHTFKLVGGEQSDKPFQKAEPYGGKQYQHGVNNVLTSANSRTFIPAHTMYNNFYLNVTESDGNEKMASKMIRVHEISVPLHNRISVAIQPKPEYAKFLNKLVLMEYDPGSRSSEARGAKVVGNMVSYDVKNFGMFYLALDTVPPKVTVRVQGRIVTAHVRDLTSDITLYRGTVDGNWILFEYEIKRGELKAYIPEWIASGKHHFKLVVGDEVGNETMLERDIEF